jgi:hypothetical protein
MQQLRFLTFRMRVGLRSVSALCSDAIKLNAIKGVATGVSLTIRGVHIMFYEK